MEFLKFLSPSHYLPHGHCYLWESGLVWLNVASDGLIALAYYSIPVTLVMIVRKRRDLVFDWMFLCFALFILACGTTHLMEILTVWKPVYWVSGGVKALTAVTSIPTAALLVRLMPKIQAIPSIADIQKSQALFQGLFENSPDAIITVDDQGRILLANQNAEEMFGYSRNELIGKTVEMLMPDRFRKIHKHHLGTFVEHPRQRPMGAGLELYSRRKDGSEFPVDIVLSPMKRAEGLSVIAIIRDITERKQAEATLARLNESLEERVHERTTQLEGANAALKEEMTQRVQNEVALRILQERNARIEEANRVKSEFVATMSHELRTPLNSIIGFAEFMYDEKPGPLNPRQKDYLGDIQTSARHLLRLINDVLDLSKIEAGKMELFPESFLASEAIEEVTSVLRGQALKKHIELSASVSPDLGHVILDLGKFKQMLYNLLSNAVKFTKDGGKVAVNAMPDGRAQFVVKVQDTGIGIRPEDIDRLFVDFHQLEGGLTRRFEGTGLGLALTRRIVEMHGGSVSVESEPGRGSTFIVNMPMEIRGRTNE